MSDEVTRDINSYDLVPYKDFPYPFTHPRHLEAMAVLFGMEPPDITHCRVLELGCAGGGNLIPQAESLPGSQFLGIDLSPRQVEAGQQIVEKLGLTNIELRPANILDIDAEWGKFDYILCHGVFSWVPPEVQEKILAVASENLTAEGVAILSYNTYPGWHLANVVRDVMNYHTARFSDPTKKVEQAIAMLRFLAELPAVDKVIGMLLKEELDKLLTLKNDSYVFHEFLEVNNRPMYFHAFVSRAEAHGLQYLAEAELASMLLTNLPPKVQETLRSLPLVEQEQYMDFVRGKRFRKTLLCHTGVRLQRGIRPEVMKKFHFGLSQRIEYADVDIRDESVACFKLAGSQMKATARMVKAAMVYLNEIFPKCASFRELYTVAAARTGIAAHGPRDPQALEHELANGLLTGCTAEFFALSVHPPACISRVSECPQVRPLARLQADRGCLFASQRHQSVGLDPVARRIVQRLDGRHDMRSLVSYLQQSVREGELEIKGQERVIASPDSAVLKKLVDASLAQISASALLVG